MNCPKIRLVILLLICILGVSSCGIDGMPYAPAEKLGKNNKNFLPFNKIKKSEKKQEAEHFYSVSELEQAGFDYSANFGVENDNLDNLFERIKPETAVRKKRPIISLQRIQSKDE